MKTSFIIPAYNEEKYIEGCLESIYALEGLEDFEVIVVDNASTDDTAKVVTTKFLQVRLVRETQKGPTWARKRGFEESTGEILVYLDADARLPKDYYKKTRVRYESDPNLVGLSGPYRFYDIGRGGKLFEIFTNQFPYSFVQFIANTVFKRGSLFFGGGFSLRATALRKIGGFNTEIKFYGDDMDLGKRLCKIGKVRFLDTMFVYNSARRFKGEGFLSAGILYAVNLLWTLFFGKPLTSQYKDIR